jgi:hypothetical protein
MRRRRSVDDEEEERRRGGGRGWSTQRWDTVAASRIQEENLETNDGELINQDQPRRIETNDGESKPTDEENKEDLRGGRIDDEPNTRRMKSRPNTTRRSATRYDDDGDCSTTATRQRQPSRRVIGQTGGWNNGAEPYSSAPVFFCIRLVPRPYCPRRMCGHSINLLLA